MRESARKGTKSVNICFVVTCGAYVLYLIMQLVLMIQVRVTTGEKINYFMAYFPTILMDSPWSEIVWLMQACSNFFSTMAYCGIVGLFTILVSHLNGQFIILKGELSNLRKLKASIGVQKAIGRIARRHNELNMYCSRLII